MFDLVTEKTDRPFREPALLPRILSMTLHVAIVTFVVAIPLLTVTNALPEAPSIMAFVADGTAPPPPPPPPPPPAPRAASTTPATARPTPSANAFAAPRAASEEIREEPHGMTGNCTGGVAGA